MNAHSPIISKAEQEARELAASILAGETQPYGKFGIYPAKEWQQAAQYLVDTDDATDMMYMIAYEEGGWEADQIDRGDSWADEADYRYDLMRDEQMLAQWGAA